MMAMMTMWRNDRTMKKLMMAKVNVSDKCTPKGSTWVPALQLTSLRINQLINKSKLL